ncbi:MAG: S8 family peptidase [Bacteroidales bacterium]|nr:S8 family peptidase [Bacteroidales bacterium]
MKKGLLFLLLLAALGAQAQIASNIYWVQFTDKNDSPYSLDNPEAYLSQRALDRRARLGIAIDEYDIPVNPQYLQAVADCGAELINPSKWLNGVSVYTTNPSVIDAVNALECVSAVRYCPNDLKAQERKERWLEDEMRASETTRAMMDGYYGGASTQVSQIRADYLHGQGYRGEGMVIAVLDGGFEGAESHPAFDNMREEGRLLGVRSFHRGHPSVYTMSSHGCSCLSTMAAFVPETMVGTAPKASYYLLHTEHGEYENIVEEYNWVSGAEYADSLGVDVCSTSLGYIDFDMSQWNHPFEHFDGHTAPMTIGAEVAATRGMLCVVAAGNEGPSFDGACTLGIPADAEHSLSVGAVDGYGDRTWFSSMGPTYDGRIKPDVMAQGGDTYVAGYGSYYNGSGTSFATPVLAGAVTCLWQANSHASVNEIAEAVRQCSNRAAYPDNEYGYGIPNFATAMEMLHVEDTFSPTGEIVKVFPNPSNGEVHVSLEEGYQAEISIYDLMGRHLCDYHFNGLNHTSLEMYLNQLGNGMYFIKAVSEHGSQTVKLLIAK